MQYFFLGIVAILVSAQSVITKQYSIKVKEHDAYTLNAFSALAAMLFFVFSSGFKLDFVWGIVPYAVGFAFVYAVSGVFGLKAISCGPLGLTMLISSYSLLIPTIYGIVFLKEKIGVFTYVGVVLLVISLFLLNFKNESMKLSLKWLGCVLLSFTGNGLCSVFQKNQQMAFDGGYKNEFMIVALLLVSVALLMVAFVRQKRITTSGCIPYAIPRGVANGIVNLLVMVLTGMIPTAILFPVVSAGGIVLGFIASVFIYKERLSVMQYIGYAIGVASVVVLNL